MTDVSANGGRVGTRIRTARTSPTWPRRAACRNADPEIFFSGDNEHPGDRKIREARARAVCSACPVSRSCLEVALATPEPAGIWGGLDPEERKALILGRMSAVAS